MNPWRFRLFGFPVTVDPTFLLLVVFLGARRQQLSLVAIWVGVVFVSILVHELGHALLGRRYGMEPAIRLHSMGGLTEWTRPRRLSQAQSILISFAGPLAGFLLAGLTYALQPVFLESQSFHARVAYTDLLWVNLGWGLLNLLPILPMDGGHIMSSLVQMVSGRSDTTLPRIVSTGASAVCVAIALAFGSWWGAFLAAWFTWMNYQALAALRRGGRASGDAA